MNITVNLEEIYNCKKFEEYFQLRYKNPELKALRFKNKFGGVVYFFELAYQSLIQDNKYN